MKINGSVIEERSSFIMLGLNFSSKLDWDSCIISIVKTFNKKIETVICSMKILSPKVALYLYKSTICPCMSGVGPLFAIYLEFSDKLKKGDTGLLVLHMLLLLNP